MALKIRPSCWWLGLLPLLLTGVLAIWGYKSHIENDLTKRSTAALKAQNLNWAKPAFDGRDGVIHGEAMHEADVAKAKQIVENVHGVRIVEDRTRLAALIKPYTWQAVKNKNTLTLDGYVASPEQKKTIMGMAKGLFADSTINNRLKVGKGEIGAGKWGNQIGFGLNKLAQLKNGTASLSNENFSITGYAQDAKSYAGINGELNKPLAHNLKLAKAQIFPPKASPYLLHVEQNATGVSVGGHVLTNKDMNGVINQVKQNFPGKAIVNNLQYASGAPANIDEVRSLSLAQLAKLKYGKLHISDQKVTLEGLAADDATKKGVLGALGSLAKGYSLSDLVKVVEKPKPKPLPKAKNNFYSWGATIQDKTVFLDGYVPNHKIRGDVVATTREQLSGYSVMDNMIVASGAPDDYPTIVGHGLGLLSTLGNGKVKLKGDKLTLEGTTSDEVINNRIIAALGSSMMPGKYNGINRVKYVKPAEPEENTAIKEMLPKEKVEEAIDDLKKDDKMLGAAACQTLLNSIVRGNGIHFGVGKANIKSESFPILARVAFVIQKCEKAKVIIDGHTDSDGSAQLNLNLSMRRAKAVVDYLQSLGVPAAKMGSEGFGETRPVAKNDTAENKALNRRIEFRAIDQ